MRSASTNVKKRNKKERQARREKNKGIKAQRVKPTPTWAIDALIGDEEQKGKQKKEEKETEWTLTLDLDPMLPLMTSMGDYSEHPLPHTRGNIKK